MITDTTKLRELLKYLPRIRWNKHRSTVTIPETEDFAGKDLHITGLDKQYARNLAAYICACNPESIAAILDELDGMREALAAIHAWQPPEVLSKGELVPMAIAIGSNGERDYFRGIASAALTHQEQEQ